MFCIYNIKKIKLIPIVKHLICSDQSVLAVFWVWMYFVKYILIQ